MAKKRKSLGLFAWLFLAAAVAGVVLTIVGICTNFLEVSIADKSLGTVKFFDEGLSDAENMPIACVQAFAIITVVLSGLACIAVVLGSFGVIEFGGLIKFLAGGLIIASAVLVSVFSATYAAAFSAESIFGEGLGGVISGTTKYSVKAVEGPYLIMVGGIISGVALILANLRRK